MKLIFTVFSQLILVAVVLGGVQYEHIIYDAVPLDGEWEMAYQPYANETVDYPAFKGVTVALLWQR